MSNHIYIPSPSVIDPEQYEAAKSNRLAPELIVATNSIQDQSDEIMGLYDCYAHAESVYMRLGFLVLEREETHTRRLKLTGRFNINGFSGSGIDSTRDEVFMHPSGLVYKQSPSGMMIKGFLTNSSSEQYKQAIDVGINALLTD